MRFISGMVKIPVATTFATALPLIVPKRALATISALAAPPARRPTSRSAASMKSCPPPVAEYTTPNRMKYQTKFTEVSVVTPRMPCVAIVMISMKSG